MTAELERASETTAFVLIRQTAVDVPLRRGPLALPQAISLCNWMNGHEWATESEHHQLPRTWSDYLLAVT